MKYLAPLLQSMLDSVVFHFLTKELNPFFPSHNYLFSSLYLNECICFPLSGDNFQYMPQLVCQSAYLFPLFAHRWLEDVKLLSWVSLS